MLKRHNANPKDFRAISVLLIETKYSSNQVVCTKYCSKCYIVNKFFACKYFYIDFPLLHKHFKYQDHMYTHTLTMISRSATSTVLNSGVVFHKLLLGGIWKDATIMHTQTDRHTYTHRSWFFIKILLILLVSFKCHMSKESLTILMIFINIINLYYQYVLNYQLKLPNKLSIL